MSVQCTYRYYVTWGVFMKRDMYAMQLFNVIGVRTFSYSHMTIWRNMWKTYELLSNIKLNFLKLRKRCISVLDNIIEETKEIKKRSVELFVRNNKTRWKLRMPQHCKLTAVSKKIPQLYAIGVSVTFRWQGMFELESFYI